MENEPDMREVAAEVASILGWEHFKPTDGDRFYRGRECGYVEHVSGLRVVLDRRIGIAKEGRAEIRAVLPMYTDSPLHTFVRPTDVPSATVALDRGPSAIASTIRRLENVFLAAYMKQVQTLREYTVLENAREALVVRLATFGTRHRDFVVDLGLRGDLEVRTANSVRIKIDCDADEAEQIAKLVQSWRDA
jgi:hypothetical protein